jgi:hypothetical protein
MKQPSYLVLLLAVAASTLSASDLDLGITGGSYLWGNATPERALHESTPDTGQFDAGLFAEYGDMLSGRIELRYNRDYATQNYSQDFTSSPVSGNTTIVNKIATEEWMLPILAKVNLPVNDQWRYSFFAGPEVCLYRATSVNNVGTTTVNPPYQAFSTNSTSNQLAVQPWEPMYSIGALIGAGVAYQFTMVSLGLNVNADFVRLTGAGNDPGTAIDHRYNVQLDLGYALFRGK